MELPDHWAITETALTNILRALHANMDHLLDAGPIREAQSKGIDVSVEGRTAVIPLTGVLMRRPGIFMRLFGNVTSMEEATFALRAAANDPAIDNILLWIDSPGGTVQGTQRLGEAVRDVSAIKKVVAQVDGMAASAAYWIASQADEIYAATDSEVGSIGVISALYDTSRKYQEAGIEPVVSTTGKFKAIGVPGLEIDAEQREYLQERVNEAFDNFKTAIINGRGMSMDAVDAVADGRMFSVSDAQATGLVDGVRSIESTLETMQKTPAKKRQRMAMATALQKKKIALLKARR